jgi:formate-dependent nitrite reductase cytochrome c552 subunit
MCDACADFWPTTDEFWRRTGPDRDRRLSFVRCRDCHNTKQRCHFASPDPIVRRKAAQAQYRRENLVTLRFKDREGTRVRRAAAKRKDEL